MAVKKQSDIYNIIGKNIKKYRKQKGLKQRELAEALYLSDSFIAKLESITHQTISIDTLEEIATWITEDESGTKVLIDRVTELEETKISRLDANGFDTVYAINSQGKDTFFRVTTDRAAQIDGRLPIYREAGVDYDSQYVNATIPVCNPSGAFDAANKSYVDTEVQNLQRSKVDKTSEASKIYGTDGNGNQVTYSFDPFSTPDKTEKGFGDIPKYISSIEEAYQYHIPNKTILVGEPIELTDYYDRKLTEEEYIEADNKIRNKMLMLREEHRQFLNKKNSCFQVTHLQSDDFACDIPKWPHPNP